MKLMQILQEVPDWTFNLRFFQEFSRMEVEVNPVYYQLILFFFFFLPADSKGNWYILMTKNIGVTLGVGEKKFVWRK